MAEYKRAFRPSRYLDQPYAMVAAFAIVGESDEHARRLARPVQVGFLQVQGASRSPAYPSAAEAEAHRFTADDEALVERLFAPQLIGGPETVGRRLEELIARTGADEVMAVTMVPDPTDRIRSYDRLAQVAGLVSPVATPV